MTSTARLILGDCLDVLPTLPDASFDACLTDPPYGLRFMGRLWDHGVPSAEVWREVLRVLKPGAYLFAFGGTRTFHRLACAIEDAGFEIRDSVGVAWCYAEGMPKGINVSKAIDRAAGAERGPEARHPGHSPQPGVSIGVCASCGKNKGGHPGSCQCPRHAQPVTPEAARWEGWNSALKPAWEPVVVAMKPPDGTYAQNALRHGVAGFNVDAGRIAASGGSPASKRRETARRTGNVPVYDRPAAEAQAEGRIENRSSPEAYFAERPGEAFGRWPPNLVLVHHPECRQAGTRRVSSSAHYPATRQEALVERREGTEEVESWECAPGCAVAAMDRQSGTRTSGGMTAGTPRHNRMGYAGALSPNAATQDFPAESGPASRFFFRAAWEADDFFPFRFESKAAPGEREIGMRLGEKCRHPTLKPLQLTAWLARLLLPPARGGDPRRLLVPFSGAGSEMIGGVRAGWEEIVGVESDPQAIRDAEERLRGDGGLLVEVRREVAPAPESR